MFKNTVFCVLFAFASVIVFADQHTNPSKDNASPALTMSTPAAEATSPTEINKATGALNSSGNPSEARAKITDWMQALASLAVLAVIIVQSWLYKIQMKLMQRQLLAMERTVTQTQELIKATSESVDLARQSFRIGTRAFVTIHSITADLTRRRIFIAFENIGKIPAENLKIYLEMATSIPDLQWERAGEVRQWFATRLDRNYGSNSIAPGVFKAEFVIELDRYLTDAEICLVSQQEGYLTVHGYAKYDDGFDTGQRSPFAVTYYAKDNKWLLHPVWPEHT